MKRLLLLICWILTLPCWSFAHGPEGDEAEHADRSRLSKQALEARGVRFLVAGGGELRQCAAFNGRVGVDQNALAHIHPRFPGVVVAAKKQVGETVQQGEVIASVESNQSLQRYDVIAPMAGTVLYRHATVGEVVLESEPIFVISDLSQVWLDLFVYPTDYNLLAPGQRVVVAPEGSRPPLESRITFISAVVDERTQARIARAILPNPNQALYPEQFVSAQVAYATFKVSIAVDATAVQSVGKERVVYVLLNGDRVEPRPVRPGRSDEKSVEVLSGLQPGEVYAAGDTFILKAEAGKAGAEHEH